MFLKNNQLWALRILCSYRKGKYTMTKPLLRMRKIWCKLKSNTIPILIKGLLESAIDILWAGFLEWMNWGTISIRRGQLGQMTLKYKLSICKRKNKSFVKVEGHGYLIWSLMEKYSGKLKIPFQNGKVVDNLCSLIQDWELTLKIWKARTGKRQKLRRLSLKNCKEKIKDWESKLNN